MRRDRTPLAGLSWFSCSSLQRDCCCRSGRCSSSPSPSPRAWSRSGCCCCCARAGVVRPGALLLPRRLRRRRARALLRRVATSSSQMLAGGAVGRRRRLRARLPARALPRHLLRPAQPRAVDDPVRAAGEERGARLDRRLQHPAAHAVRHPARRRTGCATRCWRPRPRWRSSRRCWCTATSARRSAGWRRRSRTTRSASSTWAPRRAARCTSSTSSPRRSPASAARSPPPPSATSTRTWPTGPPPASSSSSPSSPARGSVLAPFAGALLYGVIHTTAYDLSPNTWQMSLGIALLLLIVFLPEGLWSLFRRRARHS